MGDNDRMNHEEEKSGDGASVDFLLEWEEAELPQHDDRLEPTKEAGSYLTDTSLDETPDRQSDFPSGLQYEEKTSWKRTELSEELSRTSEERGIPPSTTTPVPQSNQLTLPSSQPAEQEKPDTPGLTPSRDMESPAAREESSGSVPAGAAATQQSAPASQAEKPAATGAEALPAETTPQSSEAIQEEGEREEFFQWTAERNKAIEEALSETSEARLPTVHSQLDAIRRSLEKGEITGKRALTLLGEIETYLGEKIDCQKNKVTVAHEAVIGARSDLLKGLYSYQESVNSLKEYLTSREDVQIHLSVYTADQATSFIAQARHTIMEAKPETPDESTN